MPNAGGVLYAIGPEDLALVKIGYTTKPPAQRLQTLQIGYPFPLHLRATFPVDGPPRPVEAAVHRFLRDERQRGEWFAIAIPDDAAFADLVLRAMRWVAEEDARRRAAEGPPSPAPDAPQPLPRLRSIDQRLLMLRKRHDWSLAELSRRSGVPHNTLYCYEHGIRQPEGMSLSVGKQLARTFGVTLDYLSGLSEDIDARA